MHGQLHFGYPWWLSYGHLVLFGMVAVTLAIGAMRRWRKIPMVLLGSIALWSFAAFLASRFVLDFNGRATLPTENFLPDGSGRVLDIGAGTGRSTIMVLEARPKTTVVALDQFGASYDQHFGKEGSPEDRLLGNLRAAGVSGRARVHAGDMRKLPFSEGEFDAIVSAYAIDHLGRDGIVQALHEAARVVKPNGEFLLMLIGKDPWLQFTFGPVLLHSGFRGSAWWKGRLEEAGFQISESGTKPATLYLLAHRR